MRTQRFDAKKLLRIASAALMTGCLSLPVAPQLFAQESSSPAAQQGAASDADIQSSISSQLRNDAQLQGQPITASVNNGQVTLSGTVQTEQQWQQAQTDAANANGVRTIQNNITIAGQGGPSQTPPPPPEDQQQPNGAYPQGQYQPPPPPPPDQAQPNAQAPYGQPNYYNQSQNGYGAPPPPPPQQQSGPVSVPAGTLLQIRTSEPLDTNHLKDGAVFQATAAGDVYEGNVLAVPRGATFEGTVVKAKKAGPLGGSATLELQLTSINLGGRVYPLATDVWSNKGPNKAGYTAGNAVSGAAVGAILGGILGRGAGAAIGAGAGAAAGLGASAATRGPRIILPPETLLDFHLANPVTVQPVSWQEAQRLAASVPQLQRRVPPPPPYYYSPYRGYYGW
jgi:BON domain